MRKLSDLEVEILKSMNHLGGYKGRFEVWNRDSIQGNTTQEQVGETLNNLSRDGFLQRMDGVPGKGEPYFYAISANGRDYLDEF